MKFCLLCGKAAENNVATCPNDGEASWLVVEDAPEPVAETPKRSAGRPKKSSS